MSIELRSGINNNGNVFFVLQDKTNPNVVWMWEPIWYDMHISTADWFLWPPDWAKTMMPVKACSKLSFLLHTGRDLESTIKAKKELRDAYWDSEGNQEG